MMAEQQQDMQAADQMQKTAPMMKVLAEASNAETPPAA